MNAQAKYAARPLARPNPKPTLQVLTGGKPQVNGRFTISVVIGVIAALVTAVLVITSYTTALAMDSKQMLKDLAVLEEQNQALQLTLDERSSYEWLETKARSLGLVPYTDYGYVNLQTGEITGGTPAR